MLAIQANRVKRRRGLRYRLAVAFSHAEHPCQAKKCGEGGGSLAGMSHSGRRRAPRPAWESGAGTGCNPKRLPTHDNEAVTS